MRKKISNLDEERAKFKKSANSSRVSGHEINSRVQSEADKIQQKLSEDKENQSALVNSKIKDDSHISDLKRPFGESMDDSSSSKLLQESQ